MKKFKLISTILLIAILSSVLIMPTMALEAPLIGANSAILLDANTGNVLFAHNEDAQAAPASLTKIMTVMLAIEAVDEGNFNLYDNVTASENMTFDLIPDGSTANIVVGETMSLEELLYCAMVVSANEACNIIAEYIGGTISQFVAQMNARAAELGCTGTNFVNTHGIPDANHYTTARDMALISMAAVSKPSFAQICNTAEYDVQATNLSEARHLVTTNGLLTQNTDHIYSGYYYEPASGIKTGHTEAAGYCLASSAQQGSVSLICVVMGGKAVQNGETTTIGSFTDTITLYNWGFDNYSYRDIIKITDLIAEVPVEMGTEDSIVTLHPQNAVRALLPNDDDLQTFEQKIVIYSERDEEPLVAPVAAGDVLGEISIVRDGLVYGSSLLVASSSVDLSYSQFISQRLSETLKKPGVIIAIIVIVLLIGGYIFLLLRYRKSKREYMKAKAVREKRARRESERQEVRARREAARQEQKAKSAAKTAVRESEPLPAAAPEKKKPAPVQAEPAAEINYFDIPLETDAEAPPRDRETEAKTRAEQAERDYFEEFFGKKD